MDTMQSRQLDRLKLRLVDASCATCLPGIRRELDKVRGIEWVLANPVLDLIFVDYDSSLVGLEEILLAVKRAGYTAVPVSP